MKNARQLKTIALNLLSDQLEGLDIKPNDVVAGNVELTDEDKAHVVALFKGYQSQISDRVESRADRSAKKLASRVKAQEARRVQMEKRQGVIAERKAAKEKRMAERQAARDKKATKESESTGNGKSNGRKVKAKVKTPDLATVAQP